MINDNGSDAEMCPDGSRILYSDITGTSYQWQVNTGSGFTNIINGINYNGAVTASLTLSTIPSSWTGYKYRCVVNAMNNSKEFTIKFVNRWTGAADASWENPANWSCGTVPDSQTDVIISSGTVIINSNITVNTLKLEADVNVTVNPGFTVTVLH